MYRLALLVLGLWFALPAAGQSDFRIDGESSQVHFLLHALGWWPVRGEARAEGQVTRTDDQFTIDVRVPLSSLRMGREGYRDWALSPEFFWAARYPQIRFQADAASANDLQGGGEIRGDLQVRGKRQSVRFVIDSADCGEAHRACRVRASGELSRRAFGMRSRRLTLADRIRITLDLRLVPAS